MIMYQPHQAYQVKLRNVGYQKDTTQHERDDEKWILKGVDIDIEQGAKVALIGRNGSGKTSLVKILSGEYKPVAFNEDRKMRRVIGAFDYPEKPSGVVSVHQFIQEDLIDKYSVQFNTRYRQQNAKNRNSNSITCFFETSLTRIDHSKYYDQLNNKMNDLRGDLQISEIFEINREDDTFSPQKLVKALSGGQKQLLNILIALIFESEICKLLILDEHLNSLDVIARYNVERLIKNSLDYIQKTYEFRPTVIVVTHDLQRIIEDDFTSVILLKDGRATTKTLDELRQESLENNLEIIEYLRSIIA